MGSLGSFPRLLELCVEYMWQRVRDGGGHGDGRQAKWSEEYGVRVSQLASSRSGASPLVQSGTHTYIHNILYFSIHYSCIT